MNNWITFLQRLYKKGKRYSEAMIRFVIRKIKMLGSCAGERLEESLEKCRKLSESNFVKKTRNFISQSVACSSKKLIACIMNFKIVVRCRKGLLNFIRKINPAVLFRAIRTAAGTGMVLLVSLLLLLGIANLEPAEMSLAANREIVTAPADDVEELLETEELVVDEVTQKNLQMMNGEKFSEVILQEEEQENIVVSETKAYKVYAEAVVKSVKKDTDIDKQLKVKTANVKTKSISVMTINDYNLKIKYGMTPQDLSLLQKIVQAESGGEDLKGKILVANVILNRVRSSKFPSTVSAVVLQQNNGVAQFSPVGNGTIYSVRVSSATKDAVQRALDGEDYSKGALYFMARAHSNSSNTKWFDSHLTFLLKHGGHEFYK